MGTTVTRNNVEKLTFSEYKVKNQTHLEPKEKSNLDLTSRDFILSQNIELCLTGRAFQLLVSENNLPLLKAIMGKTKIFAELSLSQREAVINASVGVHGAFEKTLYVQTELEYERGKNLSSNEYKRENVFNDIQKDSIEENFSRNADLTVNVAFFRDLNQELTSNCSLNGDLLGLSQIVSQGKDLAALNRQLVDFLLFSIWTQLIGLFLLYARGVSLSKTDFFFLDILYIFGIATLFSMSIRHSIKQKRVRSSLLVSSSEQDSLQQKSSMKIRKVNLIISCILGGIVLYCCLSLLWTQGFYSSPKQMDKTKSSGAKNNMYPDTFVVFSTLCWLNLCYFLLNIFASTDFRTVSKSKGMLYSLGLLLLLLYFQGLTLAVSPGAVARVLHIPHLGVFAIEQLALILLGFFGILILAKIITRFIVNKSLIKQVQAKETKILEKHIERSQNNQELGNLDSENIKQNLSNSEVMRRIESIDLQKLEKKSVKVELQTNETQSRKEFRFIEREGNSISIENA